MSRTAQEIAIQAWARSVLSAFDAGGHTVEVIYSDQGGPRPDKPYASLLILSDSALGEVARVAEYKSGDDTVDLKLIDRRQGTVSIQIFGAQHLEMAKVLDHSRYRESTQALNASQNIVIGAPLAQPRRLSIDTDGVVEDRALIEFAFRYVDVDIENTTDYIDNFEIQPTYT